jgi:hypothetical protein
MVKDDRVTVKCQYVHYSVAWKFLTSGLVSDVECRALVDSRADCAHDRRVVAKVKGQCGGGGFAVNDVVKCCWRIAAVEET